MIGSALYQAARLVRYLFCAMCPCCYRVDTGPTGALRIVSCCRTRAAVERHHYWDDAWEAEHAYEHAYPKGEGADEEEARLLGNGALMGLARAGMSEAEAHAVEVVPLPELTLAGLSPDGTPLYYDANGTGPFDAAGRPIDALVVGFALGPAGELLTPDGLPVTDAEGNALMYNGGAPSQDDDAAASAAVGPDDITGVIMSCVDDSDDESVHTMVSHRQAGRPLAEGADAAVLSSRTDENPFEVLGRSAGGHVRVGHITDEDEGDQSSRVSAGLSPHDVADVHVDVDTALAAKPTLAAEQQQDGDRGQSSSAVRPTVDTDAAGADASAVRASHAASWRTSVLHHLMPGTPVGADYTGTLRTSRCSRKPINTTATAASAVMPVAVSRTASGRGSLKAPQHFTFEGALSSPEGLSPTRFPVLVSPGSCSGSGAATSSSPHKAAALSPYSPQARMAAAAVAAKGITRAGLWLQHTAAADATTPDEEAASMQRWQRGPLAVPLSPGKLPRTPAVATATATAAAASAVRAPSAHAMASAASPYPSGRHGPSSPHPAASPGKVHQSPSGFVSSPRHETVGFVASPAGRASSCVSTSQWTVRHAGQQPQQAATSEAAVDDAGETAAGDATANPDGLATPSLPRGPSHDDMSLEAALAEAEDASSRVLARPQWF